ncbi:hypothetical protein OU798_07475 [Prolixibacteraceae bacterium Z1-6]|uniref:Uncharacterized protein n=1 Tax=Draconibacterium aestuarii TaxID=2998507 RepID=A0A9X3J5Q6_9BACT|nr:hypothetical protein [Prolixibacteraceae bacterium Z1-6]
MWTKYFKVVNIVPGPVIIQGTGTVDFSDPTLSVDLCQKLFENDCRYLQITDEGREKLYGKTTTKNKRAPRSRKKN